MNGFQYTDNVLLFFPHAEGYVKRNTNNTYLYVYQYKDHLGNVRLSYADVNGNGSINLPNEILEENNYYPFGLKHKGYNEVVNSNRSEAAEKYKFGGKELNDELGLDLYDFGARNYDAAIGRWLNVDPLAEDFISWTPYNYAYNDPINWIDPTGMAPDGWIEQHDGDQTTITFDPNVNTVAEATAAGYENVSQVVQSGTFDGQYNLNSDGTVTGGDANWTRSQRYGGMSYFWADNNTEIRTYNTNIYDSTLADAQYLDWRRRSSGAITPIGGSFDIFGFKEMFFGEVAKATDNPYAGIIVAAALNKGKVSVSTAIKSGGKGFPKGFKETKQFGYQHGQKVYEYKGKYYSKDVGSGNGLGSHNGGVWKVFEANGNRLKRIGTADENLNIFKN